MRFLVLFAAIAFFSLGCGSSDPEPAPKVSKSEFEKKATQDMLDQVQKQQADSMMKSVQAADPRFRGAAARLSTKTG